VFHRIAIGFEHKINQGGTGTLSYTEILTVFLCDPVSLWLKKPIETEKAEQG